jgi:hypothetical protein
MIEVLNLNGDCGGVIPEWLIEFLTNYPLCGLAFGWGSPQLD